MRTHRPESHHDPFEEGVEVRSVATGFQGVTFHGDGTSTSHWAPTEQEAREKAQGAL